MSACALPLLMLHIRANIVFTCSSAKNTSAEKCNTDIVDRHGFVLWSIMWNCDIIQSGWSQGLEYIFHVKTTIDHFALVKNWKMCQGPNWAVPNVNLGHNIRAKALQKAIEGILLDKLEGYEEG